MDDEVCSFRVVGEWEAKWSEFGDVNGAVRVHFRGIVDTTDGKEGRDECDLVLEAGMVCGEDEKVIGEVNVVAALRCSTFSLGPYGWFRLGVLLIMALQRGE